jgi:hypothetical protein
MCRQNRGDVALAREVLVSLCDSLRWNEAQVKQIKADLDFLNRRNN